MTKYLATFHPQAWINDYAVLVDAQGPTTWDVTTLLSAMTSPERDKAMEADSYESDDLRAAENAPEWVREWRGPFYVSVDIPLDR